MPRLLKLWCMLLAALMVWLYLTAWSTTELKKATRPWGQPWRGEAMCGGSYP